MNSGRLWHCIIRSRASLLAEVSKRPLPASDTL